MTALGQLAGKIALVTGASRGIGAATAKALAGEGAHVVLTARTTRDLESVEEAIHQAGQTATIAPLDLAQPDRIPSLADAISARWGRLDILVLNAAFLPSLMPVTQIEEKGFNQALALNVLATQALLGVFDPLLKRSAGGRVIALTSSVATKPRPYWGAYAASKAASEALLSCYTLEVEHISAVRVAIVDPGATRTQMRARAYPGEDPQSVKVPERVAEQVIQLLAGDFSTLSRIRLE